MSDHAAQSGNSGPQSIQLHLPPRAEIDDWSLDGGLVALTKYLITEKGEEWQGGLLGGEYGYGVPFATDKFMMHPFCWCEEDTCPWCAGCDCPESSFHYFCDGQEVAGWDAWMTFFKELVGPDPDYTKPDWQKDADAWHKRAEAANKRRSVRHDPECDFCLTGGVAALVGGGPDQRAPNFWHFDSGLKVWWYKWIGRDMEVEGPQSDWPLILADSFNSVGTS